MILIGRKLNLNARSKKTRSIETVSHESFDVQLSGYGQGPDINKFTISGGNDEGVPPVPIPNTEVKPFSAEST